MRCVEFLRDALAEKLGRPAALRQVKNNPSQWWVTDPCFSILQRGIGASRDYRAGLYIDFDDYHYWQYGSKIKGSHGSVYFYTVHSRSSAKMLKQNLSARPESILVSARESMHLRKGHYLAYASRSLAKKSKGKTWRDYMKVISCYTWSAFAEELDGKSSLLVRDLFPILPSAGRVGTGEAIRGHDFMLLLADLQWLHTEDDQAAYSAAKEIVNAGWNLFSCLYPWEPEKRRDAALRRTMEARKIEKSCEYHLISGSPPCECDDLPVQAAHIVPYALGGSDRPWNGLWLCPKHHRITEGFLKGSRLFQDINKVNVRYTKMDN